MVTNLTYIKTLFFICPAGNCVLTNFENIIFLQKPPVPPIYWEEQGVTKVTNILPVMLIPVTSQQIVSIICDGCSGIILRLPEGNQLDFGCGLGTRASLTEIYYDDLPGVLPDGYGLIFGMQPPQAPPPAEDVPVIIAPG